MALNIEEMAAFCKKKGFIYPSAEIYGGLAGFYDFGNLGVELKNNIKTAFWKEFVQNREDIVGIDGSIITNPKVWQASGHIDCFTDIIMSCTKCKAKFRGDQLIEDKLKVNAEGFSKEEVNDKIKDNNITCSKCGSPLEEAKDFNLMFETNIGSVSDKKNASYLRPETAQSIFVNFKLIADSARMKLPFGIAQTGKAFRNEISPRDFLFRVREFEMFEIEYYVNPEDIGKCPHISEVLELKINFLSAKDQENNSEHSILSVKDLLKMGITEWHAYWLAQTYTFFMKYGIKPENLRIREHLKDELAHYSKACFDIEYNFPFGWKEIHGCAYRTDFDLKQHINLSNKDLSYFDQASGKKVVPHVIEPSQGIERAMLAFLFEAYEYDKERGNVVLNLNPGLAPLQIGVFPLVNKLEEEARRVYADLISHFTCQFDKSGSIGRRYARADEISIPYCITFDFDSLKDESVTIRNRDDTKQARVNIDGLKETIRKLSAKEISFEELL